MQIFSVIGAGGTAGHLLPVLAKMIGEDDVIHVWDGDSVEEKNITRQMFSVDDVGKRKALAWAERIPQVAGHDMYVGPDEMERVMQDGDIVFICADNMAVRRAIDARAMELDNVIIINGGNEKDTGSAQVHIRRDGHNQTPRITYHSPEITREDPDMSTLSCAEIAQLPGGEQTTLANMTVATWMLHAYQRAVSRVVYEKTWTKVTFDIHSGTVQLSDVRMQGEDWE